MNMRAFPFVLRPVRPVDFGEPSRVEIFPFFFIVHCPLGLLMGCNPDLLGIRSYKNQILKTLISSCPELDITYIGRDFVFSVQNASVSL